MPVTPTEDVEDYANPAAIRTDLTPDDLFVDTTVQRPVDEDRAQDMANNLRLRAIRTLVVSDRGPQAKEGKRYHIVDGGHRALALILAGRGNIPIPCEVYTGLTKKEEAELFELLNTSKKIDYLTMFRVRVIKGDPLAVQLNRILKRHGLTVGPASSKKVFAAVQTLEGILKEDPDGELTSAEITLALLLETWPDTKDAYNRAIVRGLGHLVVHFRDHESFDPAVLPKKIISEFGSGDEGPAALLGKAHGRRASSVGKNLSQCVYELLWETYNKRRGPNALPALGRKPSGRPIAAVRFSSAD